MAEAKSQRFTKYFPLLLDALRSTTPAPMRPAEARAWIRAQIEVPADDLTRLIKGKGKQTIFENDVHWTRFYLAKAGLISSARRGLWALTAQGQNTRLTPEETWDLYIRIRDANRPGATQDEEDLPAPESGESSDDIAYWLVGARAEDDEASRILPNSIWENGYAEGHSTDLVRRMKPGDRIATKATFVRKQGIPFDVGGKSVSVMRIKATGTILENLNDGRRVRVEWDPPSEPRDWYFYTYLANVAEVDLEHEPARRLVEFTFGGESQDYEWFLQQPYWAEKYGARSKTVLLGLFAEQAEAGEEETQEVEAEPVYTIDDIIADGSFLSADELRQILDRWQKKKNLVLQGPPGTGKTWLAKRLGFALVGSNDRETVRSRLRVVQFHPSLSYEDFVRGWRPAGEGRLSLVDGILMEAIDAAASEPDRPFVLVIEEINRGNPAQIFGEMLTLLEDTKRRPSEAIELAYRRIPGERVYIPENLYVVGTMNIADRSLAIVDLALRRRFAFVDLEPRFGPAWRSWCSERGLDRAILDEVEARIMALNAEISAGPSLGRQFRIGHSFVTPGTDEKVVAGVEWFRAKVETEIRPLLDEYWYDNPEKVREVGTNLLAGLS